MTGYEPAGPAVASSQVSWNPGAPASGDYASTWADVMVAFGDAADGEFRVSLDTSGGGAFAIPAGAYNLEGRVHFSQPAPATNQAVVVLADGAVLTNPAGLHRNVTLQGNGSAAPSVLFTDGHSMVVDLGSIVENAGAVPMIDVPAGASCGLVVTRSSRVLPTASEVVDLGVGATLSAEFSGGGESLDDWATGDPTATLSIQYDDSYSATDLSAAPGTLSEQKMGTGVWETDFTTMGAQDLIADGAHVITPNVAGSAITWTGSAGAVSSERAIVPGVGLRFTATVAGSAVNSVTRTSSRLEAPLTSILPSFDMQRGSVEISGVMQSTGGGYSSAGGFFIGAWSSAQANMMAWLGGIMETGGLARYANAKAYHARNDLGAPNIWPAAAPIDAVRVNCDRRGMIYSQGTYASGWPNGSGWTFVWSWIQSQAYNAGFVVANSLSNLNAAICHATGAGSVGVGSLQRLRIVVRND